MKKIDAAETALFLHQDPPLTEQQARSLENTLATTARAYGRAAQRVRTQKARLKKAEEQLRELRRQLRYLSSAQAAVVPQRRRR